jgi:hypothetical protein
MKDSCKQDTDRFGCFSISNGKITKFIKQNNLCNFIFITKKVIDKCIDLDKKEIKFSFRK